MDKNEKRTNADSHCSMAYYESWLMELIEQQKQDNSIMKRVLFFSMTVNAILAAVVLFR